MRRLVTVAILLLTVLTARTQGLIELHRYDALNSSLEGHVTQMLQDRRGLIWLSTWNGLYRFDGYEFTRLKPLAVAGSSMTTDRIRDIWLSRRGDIICRTDDGFFRFDINEYRFCDITTEEENAEVEDAMNMGVLRGIKLEDNTLEYIDTQGLYWQMSHDVLYCKILAESPIISIPMEQKAMVGTLYKDRQQRLWMTTKGDATVRLLDADGKPIGYLSPSGTVSSNYVSFGHPIYSVCHARDGHIWLGSKPDGLFRLTEEAPNHFSIEHIAALTTGNVYSIKEDVKGRLWIGLLDGGIACIEDPAAAVPLLTTPQGYPTDVCRRVRFIHLTNNGNILMAATTEGIVVARLEDNIANMTFRRHARDSQRPGSLYCNATMDIVETPTGRFFVSTETDGISEITSRDLLADTLSFQRYNVDNNMLPSDMVVSMAMGDGEHLLVVCDRQIVDLNIYQKTYENLGHLFFRYPYQFSEARPIKLDNGQWLIGTTENAFLLSSSMTHRNLYTPPLLLTGISIHDKARMLAVENVDTLTLSPDERSVTIHFAALDYFDPTSIQYQFHFGDDSTAWNDIGTDHSLTLLDLQPGTHLLSLRSTNADGLWTDNVRKLTIIVTPTFWESIWARLLIQLAFFLVFVAIVAAVVLIYRRKRQRQQALKDYLLLLEKKKSSTLTSAEIPDPFMEQVLTFVSKNIANSEANVDQMAEACALNRRVLQRKMKQLTGVTPLGFLHAARLQHARNMLVGSSYTVSEVAYRSGFTNPEIFSRNFLQSTGMTPGEYRKTVNH